MTTWKQEIEWVKEKAARNGVPNYIIAKEAGVHPSTIGRIFKGEIIPGADTYEKIIEFGKTI